MGFSTVKAIVGDKLAPRLPDRYLARTGYQSQQADRPVDPDRRDNLWEPVDADQDHGAHGPYAGRARARSPQLWATTHRTKLLAGAAGVASLAATATALLRQGR